MSSFDDLRAEVERQPGATERTAADRERMSAVLDLTSLRSRLDLAQSVLAERLGMSQNRVSAVEDAGAEIELDTLRRYIEGLGGILEVTAVIDGDRIPLPTR